MADAGYRSIEIFLSNDTAADLSVQRATLAGSATWISGEEAEQDTIVEEFQTVIWGAMTEDQAGSVSGSDGARRFGTVAAPHRLQQFFERSEFSHRNSK